MFEGQMSATYFEMHPKNKVDSWVDMEMKRCVINKYSTIFNLESRYCVYGCTLYTFFNFSICVNTLKSLEEI